LAGIDELELPPGCEEGDQHSWHLYILRIRPEQFSINRNQFIEKLKSLGIGASVHFIPLHLHPYYQRTYGYRRGDFPAAEDAFNRCMSLPIFPSMSDREVDRVIAAVMQIVGENRKRGAVAA
jgi:perosamine synthetase